MCLWKEWKMPKTKIRNLIKIGVPVWKAYEWEIVERVIGVYVTVQFHKKTLGNSYWKNRGLTSLYERNVIFIEPPYTQTVRTVV